MEVTKIKQIALKALEKGSPVEVLAKGDNKTNIIGKVESIDEKFLYLAEDAQTKENFQPKIRFILIESIKEF